jgi:hypothetical protein
MTLRIWICVIAGIALTACTMSSAAEQDVRKLTVATTWASIRGQYGKVWPVIHPVYQRAVGRTRWEECQRKAARARAGAEWLSIKATDDYPDRLAFPLLGTISARAVSVEARIDYLGSRHTIRDTLYWTKLSGQWRGLWDRATYRAYKAGRCPS